MNRLRLNQKGVTIIELLIVLAIGGIILALAFSLQGFGIRSFRMGTTRAEIQQNARLVDEVIKREIRNAFVIGTTEFVTVDGNNIELERRMYFENGRLFYGPKGSLNTFEINGVETITFESGGDRIIRFVIESAGDGFVFSNEIYLNNTSTPTGLPSGEIYYNSP